MSWPGFYLSQAYWLGFKWCWRISLNPKCSKAIHTRVTSRNLKSWHGFKMESQKCMRFFHKDKQSVFVFLLFQLQKPALSFVPYPKEHTMLKKILNSTSSVCWLLHIQALGLIPPNWHGIVKRQQEDEVEVCVMKCCEQPWILMTWLEVN